MTHGSFDHDPLTSVLDLSPDFAQRVLGRSSLPKFKVGFISDLLGKSARRMLQVIAEGATNPEAIAALADQRLRATAQQLCDALGVQAIAEGATNPEPLSSAKTPSPANARSIR